MIELRESAPTELAQFCRMEQEQDTSQFILPYSLQRHVEEFSREDQIYLSIVKREKLAGFIILALDADGSSVEFRRIVVTDRDNGTGQQAISALEDYCRQQLGRRRLWLDVFDFNQRGRHVYSKLGYTAFGEGEHAGKRLVYYQKSLA
jgi:RimJ/RimL family protein N-acetyltransferase